MSSCWRPCAAARCSSRCASNVLPPRAMSKRNSSPSSAAVCGHALVHGQRLLEARAVLRRRGARRVEPSRAARRVGVELERAEGDGDVVGVLELLERLLEAALADGAPGAGDVRPDLDVHDGPSNCSLNYPHRVASRPCRRSAQRSSRRRPSPSTSRRRSRRSAADGRGRAAGATLVVFPEAFVSGYPRGLDSARWSARAPPRAARGSGATGRAPIDVPGPAVDALGAIAARARRPPGHRRDRARRRHAVLHGPVLRPDGELLGKHRKLMPTGAERLVWGFGDGSTLPVFDTPIGRLGAVICWENYMPLLRMAHVRQGDPALLRADRGRPRDAGWRRMRHIACEGRCFVLSANQFARRGDYPRRLPERSATTPADGALARRQLHRRPARRGAGRARLRRRGDPDAPSSTSAEIARAQVRLRRRRPLRAAGRVLPRRRRAAEAPGRLAPVRSARRPSAPNLHRSRPSRARAGGKGRSTSRTETRVRRPHPPPVAGGSRRSGRGRRAMTKQAELKRRIRARMAKTGESYTAARAHVVAERPAQRGCRRGAAHHQRRLDRARLRAPGSPTRSSRGATCSTRAPCPPCPTPSCAGSARASSRARTPPTSATLAELEQRDRTIGGAPRGRVRAVVRGRPLRPAADRPDPREARAPGRAGGARHADLHRRARGLRALRRARRADAEQLARLPGDRGARCSPRARWSTPRAPGRRCARRTPRGWARSRRRRSAELRFLAEAFDRLSREYPSTRDGLSLTERRILAAVAEGAPDAGAAFVARRGPGGAPVPRRHVVLRPICPPGDVRGPAARRRAARRRSRATRGCAYRPGAACWTATRTTSRSTASTAGSAACTCTAAYARGAGTREPRLRSPRARGSRHRSRAERVPVQRARSASIVTEPPLRPAGSKPARS